MVRRFWFAQDARDWRAVRAILADDFVADPLVSGERFVGPETFIGMCRQGWALSVGRVIADGARAASAVATDSGKVSLLGICTILSEHDREHAAELRVAGMSPAR